MSITVRFPTGDYPEVRVVESAWDDMFYITRKVNGEVGWLGTVERVGDYRFLVTEVFLPKQEVHSTTTEMQPEHMAEFAIELLDSRGEEVYSKLRMWGHSHDTMGLGASGQDDKMLAQLVKDAGEVMVAIRTNKKGEITADILWPSGLGLEGVEVVKDVPKPDLSDKWDALIKERVQPFRPDYTKWKGYQGSQQAGKKAGSQGSTISELRHEFGRFDEMDEVANRHGVIPWTYCTTAEMRTRWTKLVRALEECDDTFEDEAYEWQTMMQHYSGIEPDIDPADAYIAAVTALLEADPDLVLLNDRQVGEEEVVV